MCTVQTVFLVCYNYHSNYEPLVFETTTGYYSMSKLPSMFDFEKLTVYQKAREFNKIVSQLLRSKGVDPNVKNQLSRASLSILLNIAEGSGRFTKPDKKNFYVIARGSLFECIAIVNCLQDQNLLRQPDYSTCYSLAEEISKMLFTLIRGLE